MKSYIFYEDCGVASYRPPTRTKFYPLEPIGIGTWLVESLSGYISRLAAGHSITVSDLIMRELARIGSKSLNHFNFTYSYLLNGYGRTPQCILDALERGTLCRTLFATTMGPFEQILSLHKLLHKKRQWCPMCYQERRNNNEQVYEPLLWNVRMVEVCPKHLIPLEDECPSCKRHSRILMSHSQPGYCPHCFAWLGLTSKQDAGTLGDPNDVRLRHATNIGDLIEMGASRQKLSQDYKQETSYSGRQIFLTSPILQHNLQPCIRLKTQGTIRAFCRECGISTVLFHSRYSHRITISSLLRISDKLDIPAVLLLQDDSRLSSLYEYRLKTKPRISLPTIKEQANSTIAQ